jgi:hypothetical protein
VFWEETPDDAVIKPDITIGTSKNALRVVVLVNASDSPKESDKKYWRNIGEIFDSKTRLVPRPTVLALFFRSEIKPELIKLTAALCDSTHLVDRDPTHGAHITTWLEMHHSKAPSEKSGKEALVCAALSKGSSTYDAAFDAGFKHLVSVLGSKLFVANEKLNGLWELGRKDLLARSSQVPRAARTTLLRRGIARWIVFDRKTRTLAIQAHYHGRGVPSADVPPYARLLGMLAPSLAGGIIPSNSGVAQDMIVTTGSDLRSAADFFRDAAKGDVAKARDALLQAASSVPDEMERVASRLREVPELIANWHRYVVENWRILCTPEGCFDALVQCSTDSTMGGTVKGSDGNWLYDHLVALLRAEAGRNNDFGYGAMVAYFKSRQTDPTFRTFVRRVVNRLTGSSARIAERWVERTLPASAEPGRRGFQDWLCGKKEVSPVIVAAFAFALAGQIKTLRAPAKVDHSKLVGAHAYGLWNKLLTYQDFEPLPVLVEAACGASVSRVSARTVMADLAERAVQDAGNMPALKFEDGLICWKSAHGSHTSDKRKELGGRARALRFEKASKRFQTRPGIKKLFLVLDGTFNDADISVLTQSGWDRIFYPDEMTDLLEAIR